MLTFPSALVPLGRHRELPNLEGRLSHYARGPWSTGRAVGPQAGHRAQESSTYTTRAWLSLQSIWGGSVVRAILIYADRLVSRRRPPRGRSCLLYTSDAADE